MLIDYHTHHSRCGHAVGSLEDYIQRGMEIGLDQLGVSDHMPLFHVSPLTCYPGVSMMKEELPRYVEEALRLKEKYKGDIDIRLGIEADYVEGYEEEIASLLGDHPWDYVIGSVHYLGDWDLFDRRQLHRWEGRDIYGVYQSYYEAVGKAAASGLFDIVGHFDGIKRYGIRPMWNTDSLMHGALAKIQEHGMTLELNTSGLRHEAKDCYPSLPILQRCAEMGIPVTLGSDAHHPRHVAQFYDEAAERLEVAGIREVATFLRRQRILLSGTSFLKIRR